jgi:membrane dipeptidase
MLIAYNMKNVMGDGCMERTNDGLSRLGVALIEEMNRVGMIVDATHTGYRTTMDMFEVSKDPVIFSHSNAATIWDVPRNAKDDQIKACVRTGGVICINSVDVFLGETGDVIPMMVQHIDYVSELVGAEHVGIGTDYEAYNYGRGEFKQRPAKPADPHLSFKSPKYGGRFNPMSVHQAAYLKASGGRSIGPDWADCYYMDPQLMPEFTETLLKHGYNDTEVRGILGENIMRVAKQVWK